MAFTSLAMGAASAGMQTVGSYYSSLSEKRNLKLQAALAETNAKIADSNARNALYAGEKQEQQSRLESAQLKSRQRVGYASGGVDLSSDTAVATLTSTDVLGEIDANQIKANALRGAWGHRMEGVGLRSQASMYRATAGAINPGLSAATTLLASGTQVASKYYDMKSSGALDESRATWKKRGDKAMDFFKGLRGI